MARIIAQVVLLASLPIICLCWAVVQWQSTRAPEDQPDYQAIQTSLVSAKEQYKKRWKDAPKSREREISRLESEIGSRKSTFREWQKTRSVVRSDADPQEFQQLNMELTRVRGLPTPWVDSPEDLLVRTLQSNAQILKEFYENQYKKIPLFIGIVVTMGVLFVLIAIDHWFLRPYYRAQIFAPRVSRLLLVFLAGLLFIWVRYHTSIPVKDIGNALILTLSFAALCTCGLAAVFPALVVDERETELEQRRMNQEQREQVARDARDRQAREEQERREKDEQAREKQRRLNMDRADQMTKETSRLECDLLYALYAADIGHRFPRSEFDQFVNKYMRDNLLPAEVEERGRQLQKIIRQHVDKVQPPPKFGSLADIDKSFKEQENQIEGMSDKRLQKILLVQLRERHAELTGRFLEGMGQ